MTPEECRALYQKWLDEAMEAYRQLQMGGSVRVIVDQNSERVEYTAANRQSLWAWILQLKAAIASNDPCNAIGKTGKPVGFLF